MRDFKSYLEEGRDAPLYHGTDKIRDIIKTNQLKGNGIGHLYNTLKGIPGSGNLPEKPDLSKNVYGVSLTRNIKIALQFNKNKADVDDYTIIELDQRKLSQRYKIVPINFFSGFSTDEPARSKGALRKEVGSEYEEYLIGDIKNLNKYVIRFYIFSKENPLYGKNNVLFIENKNALSSKVHR